MKYTIMVNVEYRKEIIRTIQVGEKVNLFTLGYLAVRTFVDKPIIPVMFKSKRKEVFINDLDENTSLFNETLKSLNVKSKEEFQIYYHSDIFLTFKVLEVSSDEKNIDEFVVLSGNYAVLPQYKMINAIGYITLNVSSLPKTYVKYKETKFDIDEINKHLHELEKRLSLISAPKSITLNVNLEGFKSKIKRKIIVNSNITLDTFCRCICTIMRADLSHLYGLCIENFSIDEEYYDIPISYLVLEENQSLKLYYDFGDNWLFNLKVSQISDGYKEKPFSVVSGKGYGIVDDCGGIWGLEDIFNGTSNYFEKRDITDFDLDECNKWID